MGIAPSADQTTLTAAQANILASSKANCALLNNNEIKTYISAYNDYCLAMGSGSFVPVERRTPPAPPFAWVLAPADANGFVFYIQSTTETVCAQLPPVTYVGGITAPVYPPDVVAIGHQIIPGWFSVLPNDTWPAGKETEAQPDGHVYVKQLTIGGAWYHQIS